MYEIFNPCKLQKYLHLSKTCSFPTHNLEFIFLQPYAHVYVFGRSVTKPIYCNHLGKIMAKNIVKVVYRDLPTGHFISEKVALCNPLTSTREYVPVGEFK